MADWVQPHGVQVSPRPIKTWLSCERRRPSCRTSAALLCQRPLTRRATVSAGYLLPSHVYRGRPATWNSLSDDLWDPDVTVATSRSVSTLFSALSSFEALCDYAPYKLILKLAITLKKINWWDYMYMYIRRRENFVNTLILPGGDGQTDRRFSSIPIQEEPFATLDEDRTISHSMHSIAHVLESLWAVGCIRSTCGGRDGKTDRRCHGVYRTSQTFAVHGKYRTRD